ncbi:MAG: nucleoside-diphosphate sugar epimerase/dehydratase [Deltaproteobacteria bacterium]|nr:nucleoside-diphosphate sugar epimerase/dehydratase [Deltaproteobacteria bacterium]
MRQIFKRLRFFLLNRRWLWVRTVIFFYDIMAVVAAWLGATYLFYNFSVPGEQLKNAYVALPLLMFCQISAAFPFRLDRIVARFIAPADLIRIIEAAFAAVLVSFTVMFYYFSIPFSVFVIDFLLLVSIMSGGRLVYRFYTEGFSTPERGIRTIIVGAGRAGELLLRDLLHKEQDIYKPIGFVDDDRLKLGKEILGVKVLGRTRELPVIARRLDVEMVLLAIPSASQRTVKRIAAICKSIDVPCRMMPSFETIMTGNLRIKNTDHVQIEPVQIAEDVLGRKPVHIDDSLVRQELEGKTVLVSGAGGSIGGELCRQIAELSPNKLILLEASEFALYQIEMQLKERLPYLPIRAVLGNVCDPDGMRALFDEEGPDIVFHAAAYKHVPIVELNAKAGVETNVFGTRMMADVSHEFGVEKFVLISTDKAVKPTNVMGATKRVAEIYCQNLNDRSDTAFIITRFGNVLESSGSVVPLFRSQIQKGGPVTVTHPEIRRFFMTTHEACQLVLQAASLGNGGEIFVLDMGEPVKIVDLAEQVIRLYGLIPDVDVHIKFTGLRPGEKLYEELFYPAESLTPTAHPKVLLAMGDGQRDWVWFNAQLKRLKAARGEEEIRKALKSIVTEYKVKKPASGMYVQLESGREG